MAENRTGWQPADIRPALTKAYGDLMPLFAVTMPEAIQKQALDLATRIKHAIRKIDAAAKAAAVNSGLEKKGK